MLRFCFNPGSKVIFFIGILSSGPSGSGLRLRTGLQRKQEDDSKGGISRLAKMRKPQCAVVHKDFRIKRNEESTLLSRPS